MIDRQTSIAQTTEMDQTSRPGIEQMGCFRFGFRVHALTQACCVSAKEVSEATSIRNEKLSKWKREDADDRPLTRLDEAWILARYFSEKLGVEPHVILRYLADDELPDDLPQSTIKAAWATQLTDPEPLDHIRSLPLNAKPKKSP